MNVIDASAVVVDAVGAANVVAADANVGAVADAVVDVVAVAVHVSVAIAFDFVAVVVGEFHSNDQSDDDDSGGYDGVVEDDGTTEAQAGLRRGQSASHQ